MANRLEGKTAVITGGNSGIGYATAKLFIQNGAKLAITGRNQETLDSASAELGENAIALNADTSDLGQAANVFETVNKKFGKIDVLFLNAGIAPLAPIEAATEELFDQVFDINVKGLYFNVQKALPYLNDGASIIFTTSAVVHKGNPNLSIYTASKGAVRALARAFAAELAPRGIRVNVVSPGPIETPIFGKMGLTDEQAAEMKVGFTSMVPMGRFGKADEIANAVLYLADGATYSTGSEIAVDGGFAQL